MPNWCSFSNPTFVNLSEIHFHPWTFARPFPFKPQLTTLSTMAANEADSVEKNNETTVQEAEADVDIHRDKGANVLDTYDGDKDWTKEEENRLRRKIDYKLMPILCFTYGLQYYDKAMLGQAVSPPVVEKPSSWLGQTPTPQH